MSRIKFLGQFYGQSLKRLETSGIALVESAYSPAQKNPRHAHEDPTFCLVLQGGFSEFHRRKVIACGPSTLLFYPPDESHEDHFQALGGRCLIIRVKPLLVERLREHSASLDRAAHFQGGRLTGIAIKLYQELRLEDELSLLSIEGLALEMLAESSRCLKQSSSRAASSTMERAREFLHARFSERFTLEEIACTVGLHPVYLASAFRRQYHCTVGEYIRRLRIEFACRELLRSREPLANLAAAAGFFDQSHFTRTFKRATGMTPSQYRAAGAGH